ncbi:alpha/beta hydrolase family esterase [Jannaschia rubra]|uniref:Putative hydrolase n=1 Tax=Jannaschia rubra TaxID=282197 RepID=A0A0M6XN89_9RHOB|nr:PHB depolymerase family esterase [Jannaschia rubra]CTQ32152.1 putative hydrolase [Jannaschia rubra]SFG36427.1 polyhydroxybutyrate depolymerase [Jannaschia rubra]
MRVLILLLCLLGAPAMACGPDSDCAVENGTYRIRLPDAPPQGAILFAHGYRGTAEGIMGNAALERMARDLGVVLVALQSAGEDWAIPDAPSEGRRPARDEVAYVQAVKADVVDRFGMDPERFMLAGFSAGGMMVWNAACKAGDAFAVFVPLSGTFWKGPPATCPTGAVIWHFHGTADAVVPVAGRQIGPARQGDVNAVLAMYRNDRSLHDAVPAPVDDLDCARGEGADAMLQYCLHPGGHTFDAGWLARVWRATFDG